MLLEIREGIQSALEPAGRSAYSIAELFWWMTLGAAIIWAVVVGLAVYALRVEPRPHEERSSKVFVIGGGVVVPTLVLAGLLGYGLNLLPALVAPAPAGSLRISVTGEQWWWRVRYQLSDGREVELANEVRLPVGEPAEFDLSASDVIHSFWIPSLAGKTDMIPGRRTRLAVHPTRTGVFRGACAEFCGSSHALMAFYVVVLSKAEFEEWLTHQASSASAAGLGAELFLANGCGACHSIRGTPAEGRLGPDLTHIGGRMSLAAATLANDPPSRVQWIAAPGSIKPGAHMPAFGMLPPDEIRALATYLETLQ